jgi:hypothetical protein
MSQSPDPKKNKRETLNTFPDNKKNKRRQTYLKSLCPNLPILKKIA